MAAAAGVERIAPWHGRLATRSAGYPTARGSRPSGRARPGRRTCGCCPSPASPRTGPAPARSPTRGPPSWRRPLSPGRVPRRRADHGHRPRRAAGGGHAVAARERDRQARWPAGPDDHLSAWRPDLAVATGASSRSSSCSPARATPSSTSTSAARRATAGPSATPTTANGATPTSTTHRRGALGPGAALVGRPARHLRRVVRRVRGPVRARRGARHVGGRHRPVRRLRDRRELPPRRPTRPPGPASA